MTQQQWAVALTHYFDKKSRDREDILQGIEYLAMMVTINPKGVGKLITTRRKQKKMEEEKGSKEYLTVNENGENEFGHHVNTTFFEDLKKYGGEEALKGFENPQDYKIEKNDEEYLDEDDKFLKEAKKMMKEREREIEEEEKFKEEHPELFNQDEILF